MVRLLRRVGHAFYAVWDSLTYMLGRIAIVFGAIAVGAYAGFLAYILADQFYPHEAAMLIGVVVFFPFTLMALVGVAKIASGDWRW